MKQVEVITKIPMKIGMISHSTREPTHAIVNIGDKTFKLTQNEILILIEGLQEGLELFQKPASDV